MARPTKRTPEREKKLLEALAAGNYRVSACAYAGISEDTLAAWLKRYPDFAERVRQAEAQTEIVAVMHWRKKFGEDWRSARDFVARRYPDRWANQDKLDIDQTTTHVHRFYPGVRPPDADG